MLLETPLAFLDYDVFGTTFGIIAIFAFYFLNIKRRKQVRTNLFVRLQNLTLRIGKHIYLPRFLSEGTLFLIIESVLFAAIQMLPAGPINKAFGNALNTGGNYFGLLYFAPVVYFIIFALLGTNVVKQFDFMTPAFPLILIFAKLGCFSGGCCRGVEMENGIYNVASDMFEFPSQLLEAFVALALFIFFMYYRDKAKPGTMFPLYLTLYSSIRFFTEFTRCEKDIFYGLKLYQILCLIGTVLGLIYLLIAHKFGSRMYDWFERRQVSVNEEYYTACTELRNIKSAEIKEKIKQIKKRREVKKKKGRIKF